LRKEKTGLKVTTGIRLWWTLGF